MSQTALWIFVITSKLLQIHVHTSKTSPVLSRFPIFPINVRTLQTNTPHFPNNHLLFAQLLLFFKHIFFTVFVVMQWCRETKTQKLRGNFCFGLLSTNRKKVKICLWFFCHVDTNSLTWTRVSPLNVPHPGTNLWRINDDPPTAADLPGPYYEMNATECVIAVTAQHVAHRPPTFLQPPVGAAGLH